MDASGFPSWVVIAIAAILLVGTLAAVFVGVVEGSLHNLEAGMNDGASGALRRIGLLAFMVLISAGVVVGVLSLH